MFWRKKETPQENLKTSSHLTEEAVLPITLELADASKNVYKFTLDMKKAIQQLVELSGGISHLSHEAVSNVHQFHSSMSQMTEAIEHIDHLVTDNKNHSLRTVEAIEKGGLRLGETVQHIEDVAVDYEHTLETLQNLNNYSKNISSITTYMDSIAAKTSLLSINASIEATRAGEAGQGFLVITHEIKVLAEQSKKFSKDIEEMLVNIKKCIHQMDTSTQVNFKKIKATQEATATLTHVLSDVLQSSYALNHNIESTSKSSNEIKLAIHSGTTQLTGLQDTIQDNNEKIEEMVTIIHTQAKGVDTLENVNEKVKNLSARQLELVMGEKLRKELNALAEEVRHYAGAKDPHALQQLCHKYHALNIYYGNSTGSFIYSNNPTSIGLNIFNVNPSFKHFYTSHKVIEIFELSRNIFTGEVTQFVGIKDAHSSNFISIGFALDGLIKLYGR
ncbi:MAG: methyl-accepting chemotaxis protein [Cellulosilyticaceae bacterium]